MTATPAPQLFLNMFDTTYEGFPAATFDNSLEYHNCTAALKNAGRSFKTKIVKEKRNGKKRRSFIVMLVEGTQ